MPTPRAIGSNRQLIKPFLDLVFSRIDVRSGLTSTNRGYVSPDRVGMRDPRHGYLTMRTNAMGRIKGIRSIGARQRPIGWSDAP